MNNDLIRREALKKAINTYDKFACLHSGKLEPFRNLEHSEMFEPYVHLRDIRNAIDNAPTVNIEDEIAGAYNEGYMCGSREAEKARPQGEWIISQTMDCHSDIINIYTCPFCGKKEYSAYPYCHCGARMKRSDEE